MPKGVGYGDGGKESRVTAGKLPKQPNESGPTRMKREYGSGKGGSGDARPPKEKNPKPGMNREYGKGKGGKGAMVRPGADGASMIPRGGDSTKIKRGTISASHGTGGGGYGGGPHKAGG